MDTFVGGAGNDTFTANNAALGTLDSIDGGAGTDTLTITDSVSIPSRVITATGIETMNVKSTAGSIGSAAVTAALAAKQEVTYDFGATGISLGATGTSNGAGGTKIVKVTVGGVSKTVGSAASDATVAGIAAAIEQILDDANGTDTDLDGSGTADTDTQLWTSVSSSVMTVKAVTAGTALPTITIAAGTGGDGTFTATGSGVFKTTVQANQAAATASSATTFTAPTGVTTVTYDAATDITASSKTTAATTATAGGVVKLSTAGSSATVSAGDSVQVSGSTGAVTVDTAVPATSLAAVDYTGWAAGAGVFVRNGTTVSITETADTSTAGAVPGGNTTTILVGAQPSAALGTDGANTGAKLQATATTYPEVVGNLSSAPTGNVTTSVKTNFTNTNGYKDVKYGAGTTTIYMNGGTTADVTGAKTVTIQDLGTVLLKSSSSATAAAGTSALTTVNLTGISGSSSAVSISSDAISNLSLVDSTTTATINSNFGANKTALNLSVGNSTVTVSHANATSVAVTGVASAYQYVNNSAVGTNSASSLTLTTAAATAISFAGSSDITLASSTLTNATSITASGSGKLDLGTPTGYAKVTSVNGASATGKIVATIGTTMLSGGTQASTDHAFAFTSGSGNDVVTISGALTADITAAGASIANSVNTGSGNDTVKFATGGSIGVGATVNGGDGIDTISSKLLTVGSAARITNFELLGLDQTSGTYDTDLLSGATGLDLLASTGVTYTNVEKAQSLQVNQDAGSSSATTLSFTAANVVGKSDAYAITFNAEGGLTSGAATTINAGSALVIEGIENVSIASGASTGYVDNTITLTSATLKTVAITGAAYKTHLAFDGTNGTNTSSTDTAVSSIDGSAATGRLYINTANVIEDNVNGLVVKGGSGIDDIKLDYTVTTGASVSADAGAGNDTITILGSMTSSVAGGAGNDTFDVTLATIGVSNANGADSALKITTITDFTTGDILKVDTTSAGSQVYVSGNSVSGVQTASTLTAAIHAALGLSTVVTDATVYFTYGGNTYIAHEDGTDGLTSGDVVVQLIGAHTLAAANVVAAATGLFGQA